MAVTLIDAAKHAFDSGDVVSSTIIEQFASSSPVLRNILVENISGNAIKFSREESLPDVGFRNVNAGYNESSSKLGDVTESLYLFGHDLDVDAYIVKTQGMNQRTVQEMMLVKALSLAWTRTFFKGDTTSNPKEFSGLQSRISDAKQLITAGSTSGGAALSLTKLDELVDAVENPTALYCNRTMKRLLSAALRSTSAFGNLTYFIDQAGKQLMKYNEIPIYTIEEDNNKAEILGFTEAASTGSATATSIYCVSHDTTGVQALDNGGIQVRDLGEVQDKPVYRTRFEWYTGLTVKRPRSAARLRHIGNLAVVA